MVTEKQITEIKISPDLSKVEISFINRVTVDPEDMEAESSEVKNEYWVRGTYRPHKDFVDRFKKLRKFGLELVEIEVDAKAIGNWTVQSIKIQGDYIGKKSRCTMVLGKKIDFSGKVTTMNVPQITMYPEKEDKDRYHNAEKMTTEVEGLIYEAGAYLNGKYSEESEDQLPLFPKEAVLN